MDGEDCGADVPLCFGESVMNSMGVLGVDSRNIWGEPTGSHGSFVEHTLCIQHASPVKL